MSFDPLAFIELWVVLAFAAAWVILEWQGRRLDRRRQAHEQTTKPDSPKTFTTQCAQETHDSHGAEPPSG
jgi:hypothetical protein